MSAAHRRLERIVKGFANHRRIEILQLLQRHPGLSLEEIAEHTGINLKTAWEHVRRATLGGLVSKRNLGRSVQHELTHRGADVLAFLGTLD